MTKGNFEGVENVVSRNPLNPITSCSPPEFAQSGKPCVFGIRVTRSLPILAMGCTRDASTGDVQRKMVARGYPAGPPLTLGIKTELIRFGSIYSLQSHMVRANTNCVPVDHSRRSSNIIGKESPHSKRRCNDASPCRPFPAFQTTDRANKRYQDCKASRLARFDLLVLPPSSGAERSALVTPAPSSARACQCCCYRQCNTAGALGRHAHRQTLSPVRPNNQF
jgi:hypothetical protein